MSKIVKLNFPTYLFTGLNHKDQRPGLRLGLKGWPRTHLCYLMTLSTINVNTITGARKNQSLRSQTLMRITA